MLTSILKFRNYSFKNVYLLFSKINYAGIIGAGLATFNFTTAAIAITIPQEVGGIKAYQHIY